MASVDNPSQIDIELTGDQLTWLSWMRDKYRLGTSGYVLCVLIDYCSCVNEPEERFIFSVIRCKRCGVRFSKRSITFRLAPDSQTSSTPSLSVDNISRRRYQFLQRMKEKCDIPDLGKVCRVMLDWAQTGRPRRGDSDEAKRIMLLELENRMFVQPFMEDCRVEDPCETCGAAGPATEQTLHATFSSDAQGPHTDLSQEPQDSSASLRRLVMVPPPVRDPTIVSAHIPQQSACRCRCAALVAGEWDELATDSAGKADNPGSAENPRGPDAEMSGEASLHVLHHSLARRQRVHAENMLLRDEAAQQDEG